VTEIDLGMPALASLVPISILSGIGMLLVFRRTSDQAAVRLAKSLVTAHLLEFRLFMDEPRLILKAQRDLIVANARFLKLMLRPLLVLALPMALLLAAMEAFYGHAPLRVGDPAIVTAQVKHDDTLLALKAPKGIAVETPPVRVAADRQVSWRIRPLRATNAALELVRPDRAISKSISAGSGMHYLSERRGSLANLLLRPTETPLWDSEVDWIEVRYPAATILRLHWLIWFFAISAITALALRRKFRTAF
jgi:hypothetical protein